MKNIVSVLLLIIVGIGLLSINCGEGTGTGKLLLPKEYNNPGNLIILYHKKNHIYLEEMNQGGSIVWRYILEGDYDFSEELYDFGFCRLKDGTNVIKMPDGKNLLRFDKEGRGISELNIENLAFPDKYSIKNVSCRGNDLYLTLMPVSEFSRWRIIGLDTDFKVIWQYMVFEDWAYMVECGGETVQYNIKSIDGTIDLKILPIEAISFDDGGNAIIFVDALHDMDATDEVEKKYVGPRILALIINERGEPINHIGYDDVGATPGHNPVFPNLHSVNPVKGDKYLFVGADRVGLLDIVSKEIEILKVYRDCYPLGFLGEDKFILNAYIERLAGYETVIIATNKDIKRYKDDEVLWEYEIEDGTILAFQIL